MNEEILKKLGYNNIALEMLLKREAQISPEDIIMPGQDRAINNTNDKDSTEISLDNIKELEDLKFTEELNRKARNLIYSTKDKGKPTRWFIPPNAEDFRGLLYTLFPKGKAGEEAKAFYTKYLLDPYHKGVQNANAEILNKLKAVESIIKGVNINNDIEGTPYNIGTAVKVYNWVRNGQDPLPNSKSSQKQQIIDRMITAVESNSKLVELADFLNENVDSDDEDDDMELDEGFNSTGNGFTALISLLNPFTKMIFTSKAEEKYEYIAEFKN
mgnify:CR=1 FL=1